MSDTSSRNEPVRETYAENTPDDEFNIRRRPRGERSVNSFDIPPRFKRPGWDYQYITIRVLNEPVDASRIWTYQEDGGWRPVRVKDMLGYMDPSIPGDQFIEKDGQRLMTRPMHLTLQARQEDLEYAQEQRIDRMAAEASGESAIRGSEFGSGMEKRRGIRTVPVQLEISGEAG